MRVIVKYLSSDTTRRQCEHHFSDFIENIRSLRIYPTELGLQICEIDFQDRRTGEAAIHQLSGSILNKKQINLYFSQDSEIIESSRMRGQSDGKRIGAYIKCNGCSQQFSPEDFGGHAKECSHLAIKKAKAVEKDLNLSEEKILARRAERMGMGQHINKGSPVISKAREREILARRSRDMQASLKKPINRDDMSPPLRQELMNCNCDNKPITFQNHNSFIPYQNENFQGAKTKQMTNIRNTEHLESKFELLKEIGIGHQMHQHNPVDKNHQMHQQYSVDQHHQMDQLHPVDQHHQMDQHHQIYQQHQVDQQHPVDQQNLMDHQYQLNQEYPVDEHHSVDHHNSMDQHHGMDHQEEQMNELDLDRINLRDDQAPLESIYATNYDVDNATDDHGIDECKDHNGSNVESIENNDDTIQDQDKDNKDDDWKAKIYQDIKCAYQYKTPSQDSMEHFPKLSNTLVQDVQKDTIKGPTSHSLEVETRTIDQHTQPLVSSASKMITSPPEPLVIPDHRIFKPPQGHLVPNMISPRHQIPNMISPRHQVPNIISPRHPPPKMLYPRHQVPSMISPRHQVPSPGHQIPNMGSPGHQIPRIPSPQIQQFDNGASPTISTPPPNVFFPGQHQILRHQVPNVPLPNFPGGIQQQPGHPAGHGIIPGHTASHGIMPGHPAGNGIIPGGLHPVMLPVPGYHPGMLPGFYPAGIPSASQGHQIHPAALQREGVQQAGPQLNPAALNAGHQLHLAALQAGYQQHLAALQAAGQQLHPAALQGVGQHLNTAAQQAGHQLMNMDENQGQGHLQLGSALLQQVNMFNEMLKQQMVLHEEMNRKLAEQELRQQQLRGDQHQQQEVHQQNSGHYQQQEVQQQSSGHHQLQQEVQQQNSSHHQQQEVQQHNSGDQQGLQQQSGNDQSHEQRLNGVGNARQGVQQRCDDLQVLQQRYDDQQGLQQRYDDHQGLQQRCDDPQVLQQRYNDQQGYQQLGNKYQGLLQQSNDQEGLQQYHVYAQQGQQELSNNRQGLQQQQYGSNQQGLQQHHGYNQQVHQSLGTGQQGVQQRNQSDAQQHFNPVDQQMIYAAGNAQSQEKPDTLSNAQVLHDSHSGRVAPGNAQHSASRVRETVTTKIVTNRSGSVKSKRSVAPIEPNQEEIDRWGDETVREQMRIMKEIEKRRKLELASQKLAKKLSAQENGGTQNSNADNGALTWSRVADPTTPRRVVDSARSKRSTPDPSITVNNDGDGWKVVESKKSIDKKKERHKEVVNKQTREYEAVLTAQEEAEMQAYRTQYNLAVEQEIKDEARRKLERERKVSVISEQDLQLYGGQNHQDPRRYLGDVSEVVETVHDKRVRKEIIKSVKNMVKFEDKLVRTIENKANIQEYEEQTGLMKGDTKARLETAEVYDSCFRDGDILYTNKDMGRVSQTEDDILETGRRASQYNVNKDPRNKYKQADRFPGKK